MRARRLAAAVAGSAAIAAIAPAAAGAALIQVSIDTDTVANDGQCSLREAITSANANSDVNSCEDGESAVDLIALNPGTFQISGPSGEDNNASGDLDVKLNGGDVEIEGAGAATEIDANDSDRVLHATGTNELTLRGLTITDGSAGAGTGGLLIAGNGPDVTTIDATLSSGAAEQGAGIWFAGPGTLTLTRTVVSGNIATGTGSGIEGAGIQVGNGPGEVVIERSTISGNQVDLADNAAPSGFGTSGAGISLRAGPGLTVTHSSFTGNTVNSADPDAFAAGGAIAGRDAADDYAIRNTTISGNAVTGGNVPNGAGIAWSDTSGSDNVLVVENSTLSGNSSTGAAIGTPHGGAIGASDGAIRVIHSTIAGNVATTGPAIHYIGQVALGSSFQIRGSIIDQGPSACNDPQDDVVSLGYNVEAGGGCHFTETGDAESNAGINLGALAANGGPTQTRAITATSSASDRVPGVSCLDASGGALTEDQRGAPRQLAGNCDSGAYEEVACSGVTVNVVGTGGDDTLSGTSAADGILGLGGDDIISPVAGADAVCAGDGGDTIFESPDGIGDSFLGEAGADTISYDEFPGPYTVALGSPGSATGNVGNDSLFSIENATGSDGGDTLTGDAGANELRGGPGGDMITGGAGIDLLLGEDGPDGLFARDGFADTGSCGPQFDTLQADAMGVDAISSCETIDFLLPPGPGPGGAAGASNSAAGSCAGRTPTITGTAASETLVGTAGRDVIAALGGNDVVRGLAGNDIACGGSGKDRLLGGKGRDRLLGEGGKDVLKGGGAKDVCIGGKSKDRASACEKQRKI